jgi:hypothetical protein
LRTGTKKVGITGKYGTRYGASLRKQVKKMEVRTPVPSAMDGRSQFLDHPAREICVPVCKFPGGHART